MFGQDTLYGNSMNGIRVISDGITNISNGEITATNITADNLSGDNFNIGSVSSTHIACASLQLNNVTTAEFETLDNINLGTTIQQQLDGKGSLSASNNWTGAINAFIDISASSIHLNGVDLQTTLDNINDTHEGHDHEGIYAELAGGNTMSGNQTITGIVDISGATVSRGQTVLIPTQYRVDGVLTSYPNFNANYFPYGDGNFSNLLCADTTVGGNITGLYDIAALRNMSAGGTLFVNNISNNSTALGVTSLPGIFANTGSNALDLSGNLIIRGTTTVNGNVLVNGKTISPIEFGYLDGVTANIQAQLNAIRPLRYIRASTSMFNGEFLGLTLNFGLKSTWLVNDFVSLRITMSSNFFNSPGEFPTITQSNNFYSWVIYMSVYPNRSPPNANRVLPNTAPNTLNHWIHGWHSEKHTYSTSPDYNTMFVSHPDFAGVNAGFTTWFARRASQPSDYNSVNLTIEVLNDWRTPSNISYTADPGWISVQSY